jgi:hypothetical protein
MPGSYALTRNNRRYLERVVHYLAAECGIRQFIDNGSGLPTRNNVHQVAKKAAPGSRVVYVEVDPVILAHGRVKALLAEDDSTTFIEADACDTDRILSHPDTTRLAVTSRYPISPPTIRRSVRGQQSSSSSQRAGTGVARDRGKKSQDSSTASR